MTKNELTNLIVDSNLPTDAKILVLGNISTVYRNREARKKYEEMLSSLILNQLSATKPKRVKDIAAALGGDFSVQRLNVIMNCLLLKGKIRREVIETGRTLVIPVWGWEGIFYHKTGSKEIPETYAVFTLA